MKGPLLVDAKLHAVDVSQLLVHRNRLKLAGTKGGQTAPDREVELPLLKEAQTLKPGATYPSTNHPGRTYYLPKYELAETDGGHPRVALRYTGGADDADYVGELHIHATWDHPGRRGADVRAMDHTADLYFVYRVPVGQGGGADSGVEERIALQPLTPSGEREALSVTRFHDRERFNAVYQAMRSEDRAARLEIHQTAEVGIRSWRQVVLAPDRVALQADALVRKRALVTNMLDASTLAKIRSAGAPAATRRVNIDAAAAARESLDARRAILRSGVMSGATTRIRPAGLAAAPAVRPQTGGGGEGEAAPAFATVMTSPARFARLAPIRAAEPRPTVEARRPSDARPAAAARVRPGVVRARPAHIRSAVAADTTVRVRPGGTARVRVREPGSATASTVASRVAATRVTTAQPAVAATLDPALVARTMHTRMNPEILRRAHAPGLAKALARSDWALGGKKVVPGRAALDEDGEPAVVEVERRCETAIPFHFDASRFPGIFVTEGWEAGAPHMLLPLAVTFPDGSSKTVYQDSLMPDVFHVPPAEFRLVRDEHAPFLPSIQFVPADAISLEEGDAEAGEKAEVMFRMIVTYRIEPWLDVELLEQARDQLAAHADGEPRFASTVPRDARLVLDGLDELPEGERERTEAEVDWDNGITDYFELDNQAFTQLWSHRLLGGVSDSVIPGVVGHVEFRMVDGTQGRSDVRLTLQNESDDVVDVVLDGPVEGQEGRYRVGIRNRIESPVVLAALPGERMESGVTVRPVSAAGLVGRELAPGEHVELEYDVAPADAEVFELHPPVVARVKPDPAALLRLLLSRPGFDSMGFTVPVRAAEGTFDATGGGEPLVGLVVEFDGGEAVELSPERPEVEAHLLGRLADQLLGEADDQERFFYRVVNVHPSGEGARTGWQEGQGTSTLEVGVAIVDLPF